MPSWKFTIQECKNLQWNHITTKFPHERMSCQQSFFLHLPVVLFSQFLIFRLVCRDYMVIELMTTWQSTFPWQLRIHYFSNFRRSQRDLSKSLKLKWKTENNQSLGSNLSVVYKESTLFAFSWLLNKYLWLSLHQIF